MPNIEMRFNRDILTMSSPIETYLSNDGFDFLNEAEYLSFTDAESIKDAYCLQKSALVPCFVTHLPNLNWLRLAQIGMQDDAPMLAKLNIELAGFHKPQHLIVESRCPDFAFDPNSKASTVQFSDEYKKFAEMFNPFEFDAYLLNKFSATTQADIAITTLKKYSDKPVFISISIYENLLSASGESLDEIVDYYSSCSADVVGFELAASAELTKQIFDNLRAACEVPLMAQIFVSSEKDSSYYSPSSMMQIADVLKNCGVQFARACGEARPSHAGALSAMLNGQDVVV